MFFFHSVQSLNTFDQPVNSSPLEQLSRIVEQAEIYIMNKGVSFQRNCGAASVGEYSRLFRVNN